MQLTVSATDIKLSDEIYPFEPGDDETYPARPAVTLADLVAEKLVESVRADTTSANRLGELRQEVERIRQELIREALAPMIDEALAGPVQRTDSYGDHVGKPTTMRALVIEEVSRVVNAPADRYSSDKTSALQKAVSKQVMEALTAEMKAVVAEEREKVQAMFRRAVAEQMQKEASLLRSR